MADFEGKYTGEAVEALLDQVASGNNIRKFIFTNGFTFDEDSWEEYKNADEFYYYSETNNIYIELYESPSDGDIVHLLGGTVCGTCLITASVLFQKDGSDYFANTEEVTVEAIVGDLLTDAGVGQPTEYLITEPIYDGMVLEDLNFNPHATRQIKLFYQSHDEELGTDIFYSYNLYQAHASEGMLYTYYGYYNNKTIICATADFTTFTCLLNLIPIGGSITSETDPIFSASPAATITEDKITEWNNKYTKPEYGIPKTDLDQEVNDLLRTVEVTDLPELKAYVDGLVEITNDINIDISNLYDLIGDVNGVLETIING